MTNARKSQEIEKILTSDSFLDKYDDAEIIREAFYKIYFYSEKTKFKFSSTGESRDVEYIIRICNLVRRLLDDSANNFSVIELKNGDKKYSHTRVGKELHFLINKNRGHLFEYQVLHSINPYFQLYLSHLFRMDSFFMMELYSSSNKSKALEEFCADELNEAVFRLRKEGRSDAFKKQIKSLQRNINKKRNGLLDYFDMIFYGGGSVRILRMDLFYHEEEIVNQKTRFRSQNTKTKVIESLTPYVEEEQKNKFHFDPKGFGIEQIIDHRKEFIRRVKKSFGETLQGCIWKLDYSLEIGYRYHFVLCIDESTIDGDVNYERVLSDLWSSQITRGIGEFLLYHDGLRSKYRSCAIGLQSCQIPGFQQNIRKIIDYLTRPELYLRLELPVNGKTFGRDYIKKK